MEPHAAAKWVLEFLDEGDEEEAAFLSIVQARPRGFQHGACRGGSRVGKAANKKRDPAARHNRLLQQYFGPDPVYNENDFRTRFRMTKRLFMQVLMGVVETDSYFEQKPDATGKMGISTLLKVTAAIRQLAYASAADAVDENLELSETTALKCLKRFCKAVIKRFGGDYLRPSTQDELKEIMEQNARRGFVGMVGSVDCMHWQWRNCPTAFAGQHKGKEKKPTKILEAVVDYNLRVWHSNFGSPGSLNDINVLDQSPLFDDFLQGNAPQDEFTLSGRKYHTPYMLADGIYPDWPVFVKTFEKPCERKQKHFAKRQEACRKDVERCFGVLQARWRIIDMPCRLWRADAMDIVMHACIILHNMVVIDELSDPDCNGSDHLFREEAQPGGVPTINVFRPVDHRAARQ